MARRNLVERRLGSGRTTSEIIEEVRSDLGLLPEVVDGLAVDDTRAKNAAVKVLGAVSEEFPEELYGHADLFIGYLGGNGNVFRWNAADIVANLARVDEAGKITRKVLERLFEFLEDESMVTAAHAIDNLWKIALAKPRFRKEITRQLLRAKRVPREAGCREVLAGKTIDSFGRFFDHVGDQKTVLDFVRKQLSSERPATRKKAERFLKKHG